MAPTNSILKLIARIENASSADVSLKDVRVLAKSEDPEAIDALAGLLDDDGRVGREAARALTRFGRLAEPTLRRCLASHDETVVANARALLAALGETAALGGAEATNLAVAAPVDAGNDNADERPTLALLADPAILESVRRTLYARGVAQQELDDSAAEVITRVLERVRVGPLPQELAEWRALANKVAVHLVIDRARQRKARAKYEVGLCEDPDAYPEEEKPYWDRIDAMRALTVFQGMVDDGAMPPSIVDIVVEQTAGLTDAEIGAELGVTARVIEKRRRMARGRFGWKLAELGLEGLVPKRDGTKKGGEAAVADDLPDSLPRSHRG